METIIAYLMYIPILLFSISFHEYAHALVAYYRGDKTAYMLGRLTLNPLKHIDLIGTVIMPLLLITGILPVAIAWAKPVPINYLNLKDFRNSIFMIALAGPLSNLFLAIIFAITIGVSYKLILAVPFLAPLFEMLRYGIYLNLILCFFNMLPIPPLDGAKVLGRFFPARLEMYFHTFNPIIIVLLLVIIFYSNMLDYVRNFAMDSARFLINIFMI